jgi:hypothetical protein
MLRTVVDRKRRTILALIVSLLLLGGGGNDGLTLTTPDHTTLAAEVAAADAVVNLATAKPSFATDKRIEGSSVGLVGDGITDNTDAFRRLLQGGRRTIHIAAGNYVTGSLIIPGNTVLLLDRGVTLRDSGHLGPDDRLLNIFEDNVFIKGGGARVIADRSTYTTGEQRHGVCILGASNVVIDGLESSGHGGDGFFIGTPAGKPPPRNIALAHCLASNNRRQGLSITSGRRIFVADCTFQYTKGTAPQFGIDVEPDDPTNALDHIVILRPTTIGNNSGGIALWLDALKGTNTVDIQVLDHISKDEAPAFKPHGQSGPGWQVQYEAR